jgi:hypothetical protein
MRSFHVDFWTIDDANAATEEAATTAGTDLPDTDRGHR